MATLIVLFCILMSLHCVHGQDQHFQARYKTVEEVLADITNDIDAPLDVYKTKLLELYLVERTTFIVIVEHTSTSLYILDINGIGKTFEIENFVGYQLLHFLNELVNDAKISVVLADDLNRFLVCCNTGSVSFGYNITTVSTENGAVIDSITIDKFGGTTLVSRITDKPFQFVNVKSIVLKKIPITEVTVKGFRRFPELETLILSDTTIAHMENGLLCHNVNISILHYEYSLGYLTSFPRQIFNCTSPLKLEYIYLEAHNIAYLPPHAFGNAARKLIYITLDNIGLEVIHEDAFKGLKSVQFLRLKGNKLLQIPDTALLLPSKNLRKVQFIEHRYTGALNLTAIGVAKHSQLEMFEWKSNYVSDMIGNFCSDQSHSKLQIIIFESKTNTTETLGADTFHHCMSLKYLSITYAGLFDLPERLFATNVSQLETLILVGNKLDSNTSWSDVLMPLHELKYLNLSFNMLTSWTHNLNSLWKLEMLDLSHNAINEISHITFINMTMLKFLSLEDNSLVFLTPEVHGIFGNIPILYLGSNNILKLNMSEYTVAWNTAILNVSGNSAMELNFRLMTNCTSPCGTISFYGDNNFWTSFKLPCSNTQQYVTVSVTNNQLTNFSTMLPNVYLQQCSIETLNVSGNFFIIWSVRDHSTTVKIHTDQISHRETPTHNIKTLDMTHCQMRYINKEAFTTFKIEFLDLRHNLLENIPRISEGSIYPNIIDIRLNSMCTCMARWLKHYIENMPSAKKIEILLTNCMDALWNTSIDFFTAPESMFLCMHYQCPQQIQQQCDKEHRCFGYSAQELELDAVVCLSSGNMDRLLPNLIAVLHQLHIYGFNLSTLVLPYAKPHSLTHLNLTSCNISVIPETTFTNIPHLELLVLAHNAILTLATATFHPLVQLTYMDLSNNYLLSFDAELVLPLVLLETVYLHENKVMQLSLETLDELEILTTLSLHDNPWICECNDTFGHWIVEQLRKDILLDPDNITCGGTDIPVMFYNVNCTTHTKVLVHLGSKVATLVSSVLASVLAVTLVVCILIYKYRFALSVLAFIHMPLCTRQRTENGDVRGVFAIYDDQDRSVRVWIKDSLIPFIESACPLICYDRDFILGEDMADNIQSAVEQSNCAIVLLSRQFMQNGWSCCMFQTAFNEVRERKRPYKIILILTPDITVNMLTSDENCPQDLRVMLKAQRLVYMSQKLYHETLLYLLPDSCRTTQQIMAIRGEDIITAFYEQQLTQHI